MGGTVQAPSNVQYSLRKKLGTPSLKFILGVFKYPVYKLKVCSFLMTQLHWLQVNNHILK